MPVDTKHSQYVEMEPKWQRMRDVVRGEDWVKDDDVAEEYLPRVSEKQTNDQYKRYKARAGWTGFTTRTLDGAVGSVFRKPGDYRLPESISELYLKNVDLAGTGLDTFARQLLRQVVWMGRAGVFVDRPQVASARPASPFERARNTRPNRSFVLRYDAEHIVNWETQILNSERVLTRVVLHETRSARDDGDPFVTRQQDQYRVLSLDENLIYTVQVYQQEKGGPWFVADEFQPNRNQVPIVGRIPFWFVNPSDLATAISCPPLLDLANINLHHYRLSADLNSGLFKTSLPQAAVFTTKEEDTYRTGEEEAWVFEPGDDCKYLEYTGAGLGSISAEMQQDHARAILSGARLLEPQKREAETAEALRLRQAGESASLATIVETVSSGLTEAMGFAVAWEGGDEKSVEISLNKDFTGGMLSPTEIEALGRAEAQGTLTEDDVWFILSTHESVEPGITRDEWKAKRRVTSASQIAPPVPDDDDDREAA